MSIGAERHLRPCRLRQIGYFDDLWKFWLLFNWSFNYSNQWAEIFDRAGILLRDKWHRSRRGEGICLGTSMYEALMSSRFDHTCPQVIVT